MKDFIHRTITTDPVEYLDCDGNNLEMTVSRTRTSNGFCSIKATFGGQSIEFNSDLGDHYEEAAREFARLLDTVADNACLLPKDSA